MTPEAEMKSLIEREPRKTAALMGFDVMRIIAGSSPRNFTAAQIVSALKARSV